MKINWGTAIVLAFAGFIAFILYFAIRVSTDESANHELVTESYYKKELGYQQEIDAQRSVLDNDAKLQLTKTERGLLIGFPEEFNPVGISGTIGLYRPSNRRLDAEIPLELERNELLIPASQLLEGRWDISIEWEYQGKQFLQKEKLVY